MAKWKLPTVPTIRSQILILGLILIQVGTLGTGSGHALASLHIVINEVEMDPPGPDFGKQWVEFYNPTNSSMDMTGFRLTSASGSVVILGTGSVLPSDGYLVLTLPGITLNKKSDSITLKDSKGNVIDTTPTLSDTADNNYTWQRFPNGIDTGSMSDWRFAPATKGYSNGKLSTRITLNSSTTSTTYGSPITLSGTLNLTSEVNIILELRTGSSSSNVTVTTSSDGTYNYLWRPDLGTYTVTAAWNGDEFHDATTSSAVSIFVNKLPSTITLLPRALNLTSLTSVLYTGTITPPIAGISVFIAVTSPNGTLQHHTENTYANGSFRYEFAPAETGTWKLTASWAGDAEHYGNTSATSTLIIASNRGAGSFSILLLELMIIPITIAVGVFAYKYGGTPIQLPLGKIRKRRAPSHLRPLRVLNGAICPLCFRPMFYEPKGADWHCDHCGLYYET